MFFAAFFSYTYKCPLLQLLSFDILTNAPGVWARFLDFFSNLCLPASNFCLFTLLRTLLCFFAFREKPSPFISCNSALFGKNTGGMQWGTLLSGRASIRPERSTLPPSRYIFTSLRHYFIFLLTWSHHP